MRRGPHGLLVVALALVACLPEATPVVRIDTPTSSPPVDDAHGPSDASADAAPDDAPPPWLAAPRALAPLSTARVTARRPTLRWKLPPGATGARVELYRDPALRTQIVRFDADGDRARVPWNLPSGMVFWRVTSLVRGAVASDPSPRWQLRVPARDAPVDGAWGSHPDFDNDGHADLVLGAANADAPLRVWRGGPGGPSPDARALTATDTDTDAGPLGEAMAAGDFDGDGYSDLLAARASAATGAPTLVVFRGGAYGLSDTPARSLGAPPDVRYRAAFGEQFAAVGDVNADGYADALEASHATHHAALYLGGARGLSDAPAAIWDNGPSSARRVGGVGDVNGDGFADVAVASGDPAVEGASVVRVYHGGPVAPLEPSSTLRDDAARATFAEEMSGAGDVNGDGFADLVTASPSLDRAEVFLGSPAGLATAPATVLRGPDGARFGSALAGGVDVNGDGFDDLVVGLAALHAHRVFLGGPAGLATAHAVEVRDDALASYALRTVAVGDVEGDGLGDVLALAADDSTAAYYRGAAVGPALERWRTLRENAAVPFARCAAAAAP